MNLILRSQRYHDRFYKGFRGDDGINKVTVNNEPLFSVLLDDPEEFGNIFDWGSRNVMAYNLAGSILVDHFQSDTFPEPYSSDDQMRLLTETFRRVIISKLYDKNRIPLKEWQFTNLLIEEFLAILKRETNEDKIFEKLNIPNRIHFIF